MIPTIAVALSAAPATAAIATTGLEPVLWLTVGLMAAAVALIFSEVLSQSGTPHGRTNADAERRLRLRVVAKTHDAALDAA